MADEMIFDKYQTRSRVINPEIADTCLEPNGQNARLVTTLDPGCENHEKYCTMQKGLRDRPGK